jgi:fatty acid desaturase
MDDIYIEQDKIPKIDTEILKRLSVLKPWRSLLAILMDWIIIVLCIAVCEGISYWFYPLAFVIAGTRFHGLEAMMHEAAHYRLHPNKKANELVGELSLWPMGLSLFLYRKVRHFSHHKNFGTMGDAHMSMDYKKHSTRFDIPTPLPKLLTNCLLVAVKFPAEVWVGQIYAISKLLPRLSKNLGRLWVGFQVFTWLSIVAGSIIFNLKIALIYLLFFVLPLMWIAVFSRYLRLLTEHFGIPVSPKTLIPGSETRTVLVAWPMRVLFWPHNINYHIEHHWYPSVPFYNLPALHKLLQQSRQENKKMHVTRGIRNLFHELTSSSSTNTIALSDTVKRP